MIDDGDKAVLVYIAVIIFGAILVAATAALFANFIEDRAAIRCVEYGYKCSKEEDE